MNDHSSSSCLAKDGNHHTLDDQFPCRDYIRKVGVLRLEIGRTPSHEVALQGGLPLEKWEKSDRATLREELSQLADIFRLLDKL
jgi:hypothetical protein